MRKGGRKPDTSLTQPLTGNDADVPGGLGKRAPYREGDPAVRGLYELSRTVNFGAKTYKRSKIPGVSKSKRKPDLPEGIVDGRGAIKSMYTDARTRDRRRWEAENPERFEGVHEAAPELKDYSIRQIYDVNGWNTEDADVVHPLQGTLFKDERLVDVPERWEHMEPSKQASVLARAREFGVTPESAHRAIASQLDRAIMRESGDHTSFYEQTGYTDEDIAHHKQALTDAAAETGIPFHILAATTAINSPNMGAITRIKELDESGKPTGALTVKYPNIEAAKAAIDWAASGRSGDEYVKEFKKKGYPHQGYPENFSTSVDLVRKLNEGASMNEAWGGRAGSGTGDKIRAFYNALVAPRAPEGNFLVSDTHTGGGGFAPHIANTPEETKYLSIAGIHAFHDKIFRDVLAERGLSHVSKNQSAQWFQEKSESAQSHHGSRLIEALQQPATPKVVEKNKDQGTLF